MYLKYVNFNITDKYDCSFLFSPLNLCNSYQHFTFGFITSSFSYRADENNDDVIESFSLYYIFSVFPSFVYYYLV